MVPFVFYTGWHFSVKGVLLQEGHVWQVFVFEGEIL